MRIQTDLQRHATIIPVKRERQIKIVEKQTNGDLSVTLNSGESFVIDQAEMTLQAFSIYTMLNSECRT